MLSCPGMLISIAKSVGMKIPVDTNDFDPNDYPHFWVFCQVQLYRRMNWDEPSQNAQVIMSFTEEEIKKATLNDLLQKGLHIVT